MQEFLVNYPELNYGVMTYRWEKKRLNFLKPIKQWEESKVNGDHRSSHFMDSIIIKLEEKKIPYVIIGFSVGTRLVTKALESGKNELKYLKGMKIISYYSKFFDAALKINFRYQEDIAAGGEVGFNDTTTFRNYRTVCTHVHKDGPISIYAPELKQ